MKILLKEAIFQNKVCDRGLGTGNDKKYSEMDGKVLMHSKSRQFSVISKQTGGQVKITGPARGKLEPDCLNPACLGKNRIKHCPKTTKGLAKKLLGECFNARLKAARNVGSEGSAGDSTRIAGTFASNLPSVMCTDIGSDINLMSENTLVQLIDVKDDMTLQKFDRSKNYAMAASNFKEGTDVFIEYDCKGILSTEIQNRQAKSLTVRNMLRLVTPQDKSEPLTGRPTLEALGSDVKTVLEAVVDRFNGFVDAELS